jgi:serine/threonine protein kinase
MGTRSATPVVEGYHVLEPLGTGATSTVWRARPTSGGPDVAIKVVQPERYHIGALMELAARESAILARVRHDHVVGLHEVLPLADGSVALVLDLADGGNLSDLVAARGRLDEGEVSTICTPLASALAALHDAGVIHGDVSPTNVVFTAEGKPMLTDFEAARLIGESHPPLVAGTPGFVAPEVGAGKVPSPASDVYGLGALAWLALSGRPLRDRADLDDAAHLVGPAFATLLPELLAGDPSARPGASDAALSCYEAADPLPIRFPPPGADHLEHALTQRLRTRADAGDLGGSPTTHSASRPVTGEDQPDRRRVARHRVESESSTRGGAAPRFRSGGAARGIPVWGRVLTLVLAGLALAALLIYLLARTPAGQQSAPSVTPSASSTTAVTAGARATLDPATATREQLAADPAAVLSALARGRAAALTSADAGLLDRVDAAGSPMWTHDSELIKALGRSGQHYDGLSYQVRHAEWVSGDERTATLLAVVDRDAYTVIGPGQTRQTVPAEPGRPFTYILVRTDAGWLISDIKE